MAIDWAQSLLWLLLPVAAASGWWAARQSQQRQVPEHRLRVSADYYKGINYFLNEQPDKAIDVFIRMLEVDSETVEPHLALGNLFRRRGEVDRAIRIHQNLIARPSLSKLQRNQALLELGHDYLQAGLLDRAESLLEELVDRDTGNNQALTLLKDIYEQEKDWKSAIIVAHKHERVTGQRNRSVIAHYYCQLADEALDSGDIVSAKKMARKALAQDAASMRAQLTQAIIEQQAGNFKTALRVYKRALQSTPDCLVLIIEQLIICYEQTGRQDEMIPFLRSVLDKQDAIRSVLVFVEKLLEREGNEAAKEYLISYLHDHPSLPGLTRLLSLEKAQNATSSSLQQVADLFDKLNKESHSYICKNCGFSADSMHWQCPGCRQWSTLVAYGHQGQAKLKGVTHAVSQ